MHILQLNRLYLLITVLAVIRTILTNQEVIKDQMGILVKLVHQLKGTAEESPSLPPETLPVATLQELLVLEGKLLDQEFKKTLVMYIGTIPL